MSDIALQDREGRPINVAATAAGVGADGKPRVVLQVDGMSAGGGSSVDVSGLATEATLSALKSAVLAQLEIASTLWTDDSSAFYVRRDTVNEATGVVTVAFFTPTGSAASPGTGLRPADATKDYDITSTTYTATASATGYSSGDALIHALVLDVRATTPAIAASLWLNVTTGLVLAAAPASANITLLTGSGGTVPTSNAGTPSANVISVQGIKGGVPLPVGTPTFKYVRVTAAAYGTAVTADVGDIIGPEVQISNIWTTANGGKNLRILNGVIALRGTQTSNLLVIFEQRYSAGNIGTGDTPLNAGDAASLIKTSIISEIANALILEPMGSLGGYTIYQFAEPFVWYTNTFSANIGSAGIIIIAQDAQVNFLSSESGDAIIVNLEYEQVSTLAT